MSEPKNGDREVAGRCVHLLPLPAALHVAWYREQCEAAARADERAKLAQKLRLAIEPGFYEHREFEELLKELENGAGK